MKLTILVTFLSILLTKIGHVLLVKSTKNITRRSISPIGKPKVAILQNWNLKGSICKLPKPQGSLYNLAQKISTLFFFITVKVKNYDWCYMSCPKIVHPFHQFDQLVWIGFKNIGHSSNEKLSVKMFNNNEDWYINLYEQKCIILDIYLPYGNLNQTR